MLEGNKGALEGGLKIDDTVLSKSSVLDLNAFKQMPYYVQFYSFPKQFHQ